jgi:hypothetical protein
LLILLELLGCCLDKAEFIPRLVSRASLRRSVVVRGEVDDRTCPYQSREIKVDLFILDYTQRPVVDAAFFG